MRLVDGVSETARASHDVRIEGERIVAIAPRDPAAGVGAGEEVIDGAGRTLLPGLIDAHAHYTFDPTEGSLQAISRRGEAVEYSGTSSLGLSRVSRLRPVS